MERKIDYFTDMVLAGLGTKLIRTIAFFDLETTGLDVDSDQIIQINIQVLHNDRIECITRWIQPSIPITNGAMDIHGITEEILLKREAKPFSEYAKEICHTLAGCDLAGYNILKFDLPMLENELAKCGIIEDFSKWNIIDIFQIYKKQFSHSLIAAYENLTATKLEGAHDAETDVTASMVVLERLNTHHAIGDNNDQWIQFYDSDNEMVDYAGKFIKKDGVYYFNFGLDFGKAIDTNPGLLEWMLKKDFPKNTKTWCSRLLDMMYEKPDEEKHQDGCSSVTDGLN